MWARGPSARLDLRPEAGTHTAVRVAYRRGGRSGDRGGGARGDDGSHEPHRARGAAEAHDLPGPPPRSQWLAVLRSQLPLGPHHRGGQVYVDVSVPAHQKTTVERIFCSALAFRR